MHEVYDMTREAFVLLELHVAKELATHGLRTDQYNVLRLLQGGDSLRMGELSIRLLVDDSTTTRIVDSLEEAGLVHRTQDPSDRRAMRVAITKRGKQQENEADNSVRRVVDRSLQPLTSRERHQLQRSLTALRDALTPKKHKQTETAKAGGGNN